MEFLSLGLWWGFFIAASVLWFGHRLAHFTWDLRLKWLQFGHVGLWLIPVFVILAFVFTGWRGGLALIVGVILVSMLESLLRLILRMLIRITDERAKREDERLLKISSKPQIHKVLDRYGSNPEHLKDIVHILMMSGAGERVAWSVIQSPKLLTQYLQMEANGASPIEMASKFLKL